MVSAFALMQFWRTKLCSAVKRKCEWERFWDVDKEEGREIGGGEFLICSQPASPTPLPPPHPPLMILLERGEGVACVEVWVRQGWAVAAGSWALTTYVLQLQPEL